MPLLTGPITKDGPLVAVLVGVSPPRQERLEKAGFAVPTALPLRVLLDTGSFITGFAPPVFEHLGIGPFSKIPIRTPSTDERSPHICDLFDVSMTVLELSSPRFIPSVHAIASPDFDLNGRVHGILGRDVLDLFVFTYFGPDGHFSLAW